MSEYVVLGVRVQVMDPSDRDEVELVNRRQDQFTITASSADPLPPFDWDAAVYLGDSGKHDRRRGVQDPGVGFARAA